MTKQDAIEILQRNQDALRARGIQHAALFGSLARGEARATSDVDVLIELDPTLKLDMFAYADLKRFVAELFGGPVDVVNKDALKPHLRRPVAADAVYAF
jgi:predicted nucleotidyltransferase